ncbi:hypothetical protein FF80_01950 [Devosia sp. LC5]|uniref:DUF6152 family protein n=1 Tax=Devosia sp. LC5 TaxID=1502724 RepID=UPI0004E465FB|nr:DUF6152 family protein [Devosia sp. LC5]KFC68226.1 hypothetical protein FF80_01950 [Devosia sp. LC5]
MKFGPKRIFLALSLIGLTGSAVLAHHGISGSYDTSAPIVLIGTVTQATFSPPHPVISLRVEGTEVSDLAVDRPDEFNGPFTVRAEDVGTVQEVEFSPVSMFYDLRDDIEVGDSVVILALRNCLAPNELRSSWIQLPDGQVHSYTGGLHEKVDGCS